MKRINWRCWILVAGVTLSGIPGAQEAAAVGETVNLLANSSFNVCRSHPRIPDSWDLWQNGPDYVRDWSFDDFGVDDTVTPPVDGVRVLRMHYPDASRHFMPFRYLLKLPRLRNLGEGAYTLSVYLRAAAEETAVEYSSGAKLGTLARWRVGTSWKRYVVTMPESAADGWIVLPTQETTVWLAAPQFERGSEASPYRPGPDEVGGEAAGDAMPAWPVRELTSVRLREPPRIDGRLDDACWQRAAQSTDFLLFDRSRSGKDALYEPAAAIPADPDTTVYIGHDAGHLYLAFRCPDPFLETKTPVPSQDDETKVFLGDSVEVFLATGRDNRDYMHLVVGLQGARYDAINVGGSAANWNPRWQAEVARQADAWTVEMAIPFASLPLDDVADVWRLNLTRNTVNADGDIMHSMWSPVHRGFHEPSRFGRLRGIGRETVAPYRWSADLSVTPGAAAGTYELTGRIMSHPPGVERVRVEVAFEGTEVTGGRSAVVDASQPMPEFRMEGLRFTPERAAYPAMVTFAGLDGRVLTQMSVVITPSEANLLVSGQTLTVYPEFDFYTSEPRARVRLEWNGRDTARLALELATEDGTDVVVPALTWDCAGPAERETGIPLDGLADGRYLLRASAEPADGERVNASYPLIKLPPNPDGIEVRLNLFNRSTYVNGRPFFPVFLPGRPTRLGDGALDMYKAQGFTGLTSMLTFSGLKTLQAGRVPPDELAVARRQLDRLHERGMKFIFRFQDIQDVDSRFRDIKPEFKGDIENTAIVYRCVVRALKDHPAIIGWYLLDEMGPKLWEKQYGHTEDDIRRLRDAVRREDPYRPAFQNWNHTWKTEPYGGLDSSDIVHFDSYPFGGPFFDLEKIVYPARVINDLSRFRKPSYIWIHGSYKPVRHALPHEARVQAWVYLVYGSRGLGYWSGRPMSPELWEEQKRINNACTWLIEHAVGPREARPLRIAVQNQRIHYAAWRNGDRGYVFGVNTADRSVSFDLDLQTVYRQRVLAARRVFDDGAVELVDGVLKDRFPPTQRRVYELDLGAAWGSGSGAGD